MNSVITSGQQEQLESKLSSSDIRLEELIAILRKNYQRFEAKKARKVCRARPETERGGKLNDLSYIERATSWPYELTRHMTIDAFKSLNCATMVCSKVTVDGCTWGKKYFQKTVVRTVSNRSLLLTLRFSEHSPIYNAAIREAVKSHKACAENIQVFCWRPDAIAIDVKSYYQRGDVVMEKVQRELNAIYKEARQLLLLELAK